MEAYLKKIIYRLRDISKSALIFQEDQLDVDPGLNELTMNIDMHVAILDNVRLRFHICNSWHALEYVALL